jgi:F1F0 ATPase subunit 2
MDAMVTLIMVFALGVVLGGFYFISLLLTLQRLTEVQSRALLLLISYVIRLAVVLGAFYFLLRDGQWERAVVALIGFVVMRKILMYFFGPHKTVKVVHQ